MKYEIKPALIALGGRKIYEKKRDLPKRNSKEFSLSQASGDKVL